jgi:hypothetical protein
VWSQGEISGLPINLGEPLTSITATLIPDCTVILRAAGQPIIAVIDAKLRRDALKAGEAAQHASKYLWGARRSDAPDQLAIEKVVLVSPSHIAEMHDPARARVEGITATPADDQAVEQVLSALLMAHGQ